MNRDSSSFVFHRHCQLTRAIEGACAPATQLASVNWSATMAIVCTSCHTIVPVGGTFERVFANANGASLNQLSSEKASNTGVSHALGMGIHVKWHQRSVESFIATMNRDGQCQQHR